PAALGVDRRAFPLGGAPVVRPRPPFRRSVVDPNEPGLFANYGDNHVTPAAFVEPSPRAHDVAPLPSRRRRRIGQRSGDDALRVRAARYSAPPCRPGGLALVSALPLREGLYEPLESIC